MKIISYGKRFRLLEKEYIGDRLFSKGSIFMATGSLSPISKDELLASEKCYWFLNNIELRTYFKETVYEEWE